MSENRQSLTDIAYQTIKNKILDLSFTPGMVLTESGLAQELNMSRNPVSLAVKILENEGLLINDYYKKIRVKEVTRKDVLEIYQLRELLETVALREILNQGRAMEYSFRLEEKVVRMRAAQENLYEWKQADTELHMEIVSILDNERINKVYLNNQVELIRIGLLSHKTNVHVQKVNQNLLKMIKYIRQNDFDKAYEILYNDHLAKGKDMALMSIDG